MAERRMMNKQIIDSDSFLDMPMSTQCLYFHMLQRGDDDGFINNPKKIQRMIGASDDDLKLLIAKSFLIPFESGIVVIKHWRIHNYLRNDRYKPTAYTEEKSQLQVKENGAYTLVGRQAVYQMDTQDSIDKNSTDKNSIESNPRHRFGEYSNVLLSQDDYAKWKHECPQADEYIERLSEYMAGHKTAYKSHLAVLRSWYRRDKEKQPAQMKQEASYNLDEIQSKVETQKIKYERKS